MSPTSVPWALRGTRGLWIGLALFLLLVASSWVGFLGSDDVTYARGAYGWIEQFPYVGGHGTIRYPLTIPMALSFLALGGNEIAMVLPSLLYAVGLLAFLWWLVRRATDGVAAFGALLALATSPLLVIQSSIANVEMVEAFFLFLSVGAYWRCLDEGPTKGRLLFAGAMAGCAFLTRETAIFIVPFYGLLFLAGHGFHRGRYLWIAGGFLIIWSLELIYLTVMTGDPFYRLNISLHHDPTINRQIDLAGNVIVHPILDPALVLLLNQEFMLLFFLALPLGAWLCFGGAVEARTPAFRPHHRFVRAGLVPVRGRGPVAAAAQSALFHDHQRIGVHPGRRRAGGIAAVEQFGRSLGRGGRGLRPTCRQLARHPGREQGSEIRERTLAALADASPPSTLVTDPMTRYRADLLLRWGTTRERVTDAPPRDGDLFLYNPANAAAANFKMPAGRAPAYQPKPQWSEVARYRPAPSWVARTIEASGLADSLPLGLWTKLRHPHPDVVLYRIGPAQDGQNATDAD